MSINERKDKTGRIKEVDLGLSDTEQQALAECRHQIANDAELDDMRDATLARFLRANGWKVEPAIEQLKTYLKWRKTNNIDTIIERAIPNLATMRTIIPYSYHGCDKDGRPIYLEKTGMIATAALADPKICPIDALMQSHILGLEMMQRTMYESSLKRGERVNGITTIIDLAGLGFQHRSCIFVLKECMDFDHKYYPEYLQKLYVINAPWVAPYLYQGVQVFLDEVTKQRVQIIPGEPSEFLREAVGPENLPKEYGGNCDGSACKHGGLGDSLGLPLRGCCDVLDASGLKAEEISGLDTQEVSYDFEKIVSATSGSGGENEIFTWYFEVADDMDIDFSVELLPASGQKETDEKKRVLIHKVERLKTAKGTFKAPYPGAKILLRWDNNFSYFNSKNIKYTVSCINDDAGSLDSLMKGTKQ